MPKAASVVQEHVTFDGAIGQIEAILTYPEQNDPQESIFIVGPHPMLGGDFDNNVIRELSTCLAERNTLTLRFNYRGVGQSDGEPILSTDNIAEFWARSRIDQESGLQKTRLRPGSFWPIRLAKSATSWVTVLEPGWVRDGPPMRPMSRPFHWSLRQSTSTIIRTAGNCPCRSSSSRVPMTLLYRPTSCATSSTNGVIPNSWLLKTSTIIFFAATNIGSRI